jgi:hypothetical protein
MFGLFDSDLKRVRRLRLEYEDIRQRVLYKMNPYEQLSFIGAYGGFADEFQERFESTSEDDLTHWQQFGAEFKKLLHSALRAARRMSGIDREGALAGVNGLALLSIQCSAKGYRLAEALTLRDDIEAFVAQIDKMVTDKQGYLN